MLGIEGEGMWCPFFSDLSVYGSLIIRESESCGERERTSKKKKKEMCFLLFCSHTVFADVALSRA